MFKDVIACAKARVPVVWLVTQEEWRAEAYIREYARSRKGSAWSWSITSNNGFPGWEPTKGPGPSPKNDLPFDKDLQSSPEGALKSVLDLAAGIDTDVDIGPKMMIVFRDPHIFLEENVGFIRLLRDAASALKDTFITIICISPVETLPIDLRVDAEIVHLGLPDKETLKTVLQTQLSDYKVEYDAIDELVEACIGLTVSQAADALAKCLITHKLKVVLPFINEIKTKAINTIPGLTYIGEVPSMDSVGGLTGLKEWIRQRKRGFTKEALAAGLPAPKGVLCTGIPGCGKSLFAKAVSSYLNIPLVCLNPPDVKGGKVGETEGNLRQVKDAIESLGHCVVWIDEFEKSVPKVGIHNSDGGTSDALLQGLLNWMQERKGGAFIVATANDISALPPELLRKGRWDSIFFIDLPTEKERVEIFKIHLGLRGWDLSASEINRVAAKTKNYSGAEIEAACIDGRWRAFSGDRQITVDDILEAIQAETPLYETMQEYIKGIREWAKTRARPASMQEPVKISSKKSPKRKLDLSQLDELEN